MSTKMSTNQKKLLQSFRFYDIEARDVSPPGELPDFLVYPDRTSIGVLPRGKLFSVFKPAHAKEAAAVYNYLISLHSTPDFFQAAEHFKTVLNEGLYLYAFTVAALNRPDTGDLHTPPLWEVNPRNYFTAPAIYQARLRAKQKEEGSEASVRLRAKPVEEESDPALFATGNYMDPEFKLAWWREDIGLNDHHFHWHQVYPWQGINGRTKDREGELFYYMHQQMLARYDAERIAVGLPRVLPYDDWSRPIPDGYDSHLTDYYGTHQYSPRPAGMTLADDYVDDPNNPVTVNQQKYHLDRILDAINTGMFIKKSGKKRNEMEPVTIVNLGAAVEASISSPNPDLYGNVGIHNYGHVLLSIITDPDGRYNQAPGVMGDIGTAVRDPVFFRWHKFIDNIFVLHKSTLDPYINDDLRLNGISVDDMTIQTSRKDTGRHVMMKKHNTCIYCRHFHHYHQIHGASGIGCCHCGDCSLNKTDQGKRTLTTRMESKVVDIGRDMFLVSEETKRRETPHTPVNVKVSLVNHDEFSYKFTVTNATDLTVEAAFRVFMAPQLDQHGNQIELADQRRLFIEMDKFVGKLTPGKNIIERASNKSSVIKPPCKSYEDILSLHHEVKWSTSNCKCRDQRYCTCGWPLNMLVPRGTSAGMTFDLFVMLTNWANDRVDTDDLDQGTSYCGVKNEKYPDNRAMGFPFDRQFDATTYPSVGSLVDNFDNMMTVPIIIKFK